MSLLSFAKENNLFNFSFYKEKYGLNFENELEGFNDFLRKSLFSSVKASPMEHNINKVNFFLAHGFNTNESYIETAYRENLTISPVNYGKAIEWVPNSKCQIYPEQHNFNTSSVCIHIHLYYDDMLDDFFDALNGIPFTVDILIAVRNDEIGKKAVDQFSLIKNIENVSYCILMNRGRNFESILFQFNNVIKSYDILIHLHSKKSLYSGGQKSPWFHYLIENLIRDKQLLSKHMSILQHNPDIGLLYPTCVDTLSLPKWATHVLKNRHKLDELLNMLGCKKKLPQNEGFLSYPVGGMFICKVEAIRPLLDYNWRDDDIPVEPIDNDGTILHAIERAFDLICKNSDYISCYYHPASGTHSCDTSHIFENYLGDKQLLSDIIESNSIEIFSFDIFDTLIVRASGYNDSAKISVANILCPELTANDFLIQRNEAELICRKQRNFQGDVDIYEIYDQLSEMIPLVFPSKEAANIEFEADLDILMLRHEMAAIYTEIFAGQSKVICISDMYYTKEMIIKIFKKLGLPFSEDAIFVSSDLRLRKDNGTIWPFIKKHFSNDCLDFSTRFLHIGDNAVSDIQIPMDLGFGTFHILSPSEMVHYKDLTNDYGAKIIRDRINSDHRHYHNLEIVCGLRPFV